MFGLAEPTSMGTDTDTTHGILSNPTVLVAQPTNSSTEVEGAVNLAIPAKDKMSCWNCFKLFV